MRGKRSADRASCRMAGTLTASVPTWLLTIPPWPLRDADIVIITVPAHARPAAAGCHDCPGLSEGFGNPFRCRRRPGLAAASIGWPRPHSRNVPMR
ncbi:hypothetical protein ACTMU2_11745 [Cupriavidus basilensis]